VNPHGHALGLRLTFALNGEFLLVIDGMGKLKSMLAFVLLR